MKSKTPITALVLVLFCATLFFASCEDPVDPPAQAIDFEQAQEFQNEFIRTRSVILDSALGFQDTRDFWFSLDTIKRYIEYVEYEAHKRGYKDLGIRIHFAAYPEPQGNDRYPYSTVVLVPTTRSGDSGIKQGFFPMDEEDEPADSINSLNFGHGGKPPKDL
ncbi:hypothetical protein POV27_18595 [Aureisphaera galaxeae]|uniref:hypothetical protein n=1 Tax=Aureisphaera galaxeae TaxID=1538023 RepID=UPI00234FE21D|nr:hypothetical protein [Aureisphaera galaxeae]MDC8006068.1 hypothetical protein [Aureisphaera galaxeae]